MNRTTDQAATKFGAARVATMAITAAATALALSACSTTTGSSASSPSGNGGASSSSASAGSGGTTGGSGTTTGTTTSSTSQGTGVSGATECATSQLSVAQENPSVGAGQYYSTLVFTNTSGSTCTTSGYAGVSYVVANGVQSGNPAVRAGGTIATVTLAPGGTTATGSPVTPRSSASSPRRRACGYTRRTRRPLSSCPGRPPTARG
jgi:hypothetical protein